MKYKTVVELETEITDLPPKELSKHEISNLIIYALFSNQSDLTIPGSLKGTIRWTDVRTQKLLTENE